METGVKILRWASLVFLTLGLVCILLVSRAQWEEKAGFDILGIAWLLGNADLILVGMLGFFFIGLGFFALIRSFGLR